MKSIRSTVYSPENNDSNSHLTRSRPSTMHSAILSTVAILAAGQVVSAIGVPPPVLCNKMKPEYRNVKVQKPYDGAAAMVSGYHCTSDKEDTCPLGASATHTV